MPIEFQFLDSRVATFRLSPSSFSCFSKYVQIPYLLLRVTVSYIFRSGTSRLQWLQSSKLSKPKALLEFLSPRLLESWWNHFRDPINVWWEIQHFSRHYNDNSSFCVIGLKTSSGSSSIANFASQGTKKKRFDKSNFLLLFCLLFKLCFLISGLTAA